MPRRARVIKRETAPDPRFGSRTLTRFMNKMMVSGKKSVAEHIVYGALDSIERSARRNPLDVFELALRNATPLLEVNSAATTHRPIPAGTVTGAGARTGKMWRTWVSAGP